MIIKFNGQYIPDFDALIEVEKRVKILSTLESAGDFSYQFTMPDTSEVRRILGIQSIDSISTTIYTDNQTIIESDGVPIYVGSMRIESIDDDGIKASFFSGNTNWFSLLVDNINQIDMSAHKVGVPLTNPSAVITDSWVNDEWITFPLINKGLLTNWSTPVLRTPNFMPFVYIKNVFTEVFKYCGLKVDGELLDDGLFNNLIVGTNSQDGQIEFIKQRQTFAGKTAPQAIGTSPSIVTFPVESFPYYDGSRNNWNGSSKYTSDIKVWSNAEILLNLDANVTWTLEVLVNGVMVDSQTKTSTQINYNFQKNADYTATPVITLMEGDELEVSISISSGTVNITDGWFRFTILRLLDTYPQFLLNQMSQRDFITAVFTMFNVLPKYNPYTKTVTCNLFRNLKLRDEQDLSLYVSDYTIDFTLSIEDYAKRNLFTYNAADQPSIEEYDKQSPIPYGAGVIEPNNTFLKGENEISIPFTNSYFEYSNIFQASLMTLGLDQITTDDTIIDISSAASDGGFAEFTTSTPHGFEQLDYVWITDSSTGEYVGIGRVQSIDTTTTFTLERVFFTGSITGSVVKVNYSEDISDDVFIAVNIPNLSVSDFSNSSSFEYGGSNYTEIAYAFFLKNTIGKDIDRYIQSPAFQNPLLNGFINNTLIESNYSINIESANRPVKVFANLIIPESMFKNIDQTNPIRITTKDFNTQFFCERIGAYTNSWTPCTFELTRI